MKVTSLLVFGLSLLPSPVIAAEANATMFLALYDAARPEDKAQLRDHVQAVAYGIAWANAAFKFQKQKPLYCPPDEQNLTGEQVLDLLRKELEAHPASGDFPWPAVTIRALQSAFPCR